MKTTFRGPIAWLAGAGGLLLALGGSAQAVQSMPAPPPVPVPVYRPRPTPAPRPAPAPVPAPRPGGGGAPAPANPGGGTVQLAPAHALPELTWYAIEEGLAKGKQENRPVIVVFTTSDFRGPGTFDSTLLRDLLAGCRAVPVRVLPPAAPVIGPKKPADEQKALQEKHREALTAYRELANKYGASANPTMIFLAPGGEALGSLAAPDSQAVRRWLTGLPGMVKALEEYKAKAAGRPAPAAEAAPRPAAGLPDR